ncbi:hypothetical protein HRI_000646700 [Hibiscus trionum]|uniref:Reverse transcriptase domain-containing protein n=1 Tax=Hibiscus trionum TaxID=183268 RepID=A0A9W7H299_HIBTR|nr:hypothetical protein HRI_000646700 [Hibiscus trionum]
MRCVSTVRFCLRINGKFSEEFNPGRGLRQGDPLSPYLFLLAAQGLSALLLKEQSFGRIKGLRISVHGPRVNHLLYADDCFLFLRNSEDEATRVREILRLYELASGQKVNLDKSYIYFSNGMRDEHKAALKGILEMREETKIGVYLGLPLIVGKNKTDSLCFLFQNVDKRVGGWTKNLLSFGGREVLSKSVAQALPTYAMGCFLLPDCIINPIIASMRNFLWSGKVGSRGWTHVAWGKLCRPKRYGGIGFKDLRVFNLALLGKQIWRLMVNKNSLCFKVLSTKYFPDGDVLNAKPHDKPSFMWRCVSKAKDVLRDQFHLRIGVDSQCLMFQNR